MMHRFKPGWESEHSRAYMIAVHVLFGVSMAGLLAFGVGYLVMLLWNAILPHATGAHAITYLQGVGLLVLARILVGGLRGRGRGHDRDHRHRRHFRSDYDQWWWETGKQSFEEFAGSRPQTTK